MSGKIEIDFQRPIKDQSGEPIKVPKENGGDDDEGDEEGLRNMVIADHVTEFLQAAKSTVDSRAEGSALQKLIGDIETQETEYTERSVELILKYFDKVLENNDSTGRPPHVMDELFDFLNDLEEKINDDS